MLRRLLAGAIVLAVAGCGSGDSRGSAKRVTLASGVIVSDAQFSKQGRLAYAKFIDAKLAVFVANGDGTSPRRVSFGNWDFNPIWSPDGKWLAFGREANNNDIFIVPSDSGAERVVAATPADEIKTGWLPDGSGLLFARSTPRGRECWMYHLADGTSSRVFDVRGEVLCFPSPDGKWIGYTLTKGGQSTIWIWDRDKKEHRQLTTEGYEQTSTVAFSPDSRSILYESRRTGTSDLWRVDIASGERKQLTQDIAYDGRGRWSPDGTRIVFLSDRGGQRDVWTLGAGEQDAQRVTDDALVELAAEWTPDGHSLIVHRAPGQYHLYSLPTAGGPAVQLTSGDWSVEGADVSRDGSRIVYSGTKNGDLDIWTVPSSGGESKLVSGAPGADNQPVLSPDGLRIAFTSERSGNPDVWIVPAAGGAATQVTSWPSSESSPQWSPDGNSLAFLSSREAVGIDLWTVPAAGGTPRRLTTVGVSGSGYRWSPDGKAIAFAAQTEASGGIAVFTVPASGGRITQISSTWTDGPAWSPDGREIAVARRSQGYSTIEIHSTTGALLRSLSTRAEVFEYISTWFEHGGDVLIAFQDIYADAQDRLAVRSAGSGATRVLAGPAGFTMDPVGPHTIAGDKAAIALGGLNGTVLERIDVPALAKKP